VTDTELLELLYDAVRTPFGSVIETNNAERLRQRLYPLRNKDESLAVLSFVISPINGKDLWILNRSAADGQR